MSAPPNLRTSGDRIEQLLDDLQASLDPRSFAKAEDLLRVVTELYGAGLSRVVELAAKEAPGLMDALLGDDLVSALLLVHDLHPEALAQRVEAALAKVRPLLASHGGDVELVDLDPDAGAVLIRLLGSCDGCPSSSVTLQLAVERAIMEAAPEIVTIDVDQRSQDGVVTPVELTMKSVYPDCPSEMAGA